MMVDIHSSYEDVQREEIRSLKERIVELEYGLEAIPYFKAGYSDAFYSKDCTMSTPERYRTDYLQGQNQFYEDCKECP